MIKGYPMDSIDYINDTAIQKLVEQNVGGKAILESYTKAAMNSILTEQGYLAVHETAQ